MRTNRLLARPTDSGQPRLTQPEESNLVSVNVLNKGINVYDDPADLEDAELVDAMNVTVRSNRVSARVGNILFTPAKPNSKKVLNFAQFKRFSGVYYYIRNTRDTLHFRAAGSWTAITGGALTSSDNDRFRYTTANDRLFFTNNGLEKIQEINFGANTYAALGNAPRYKYITTFYNRIVAGYYNEATPNPVQIGWSGDANYGEWDPTVDPSAGSGILTDNQTDLADFITGVFGFADKLLVLREKTIWLATKQQSALNPFYFYTAVPNIGCDLPNSAQQVPGGVAFVSKSLGKVYAYMVDKGIVDIGQNIEDTLIPSISDGNAVFSGFDPTNLEYILAVPISGSTTVKIWTYSFKSEAWWYDQIDNVSSVDVLDYLDNSFTIDELVGDIDSLTGTIDQLSPNVVGNARFYGLTNGDILRQTESATLDNASTYLTRIVSKTFEMPDLNFYVQRITLVYQVDSSGTFDVYYSKDAGVTWTLYKTVSFSVLDKNKRLFAAFNKNLLCRQFSWKIESTSGLFSLINYEIKFFPAGPSRR